MLVHYQMTPSYDFFLLVQVGIPNVPLDNFLAFLEYLYTDHAPIEERDCIGILVLSNQYVMKRLMSLCELYITKEVDRACAKSIADADVDVIGMCDIILIQVLTV